MFKKITLCMLGSATITMACMSGAYAQTAGVGVGTDIGVNTGLGTTTGTTGTTGVTTGTTGTGTSSTAGTNVSTDTQTGVSSTIDSGLTIGEKAKIRGDIYTGGNTIDTDVRTRTDTRTDNRATSVDTDTSLRSGRDLTIREQGMRRFGDRNRSWDGESATTSYYLNEDELRRRDGVPDVAYERGKGLKKGLYRQDRIRR